MNSEYKKFQHSMELPAAGVGGHVPVPKWVHLLPNGRFWGRDGRGPFILEDAQAAIAATLATFGKADMPLDYEHQTENATKNGQPAPAAGWIKEMAARADGIWARVEWTERGAQAVSSREYRYISPVFFHDPKGKIFRLNSAALTNLPNLELKALSSVRHYNENDTKANQLGDTVKFKADIAQLLGLPDDANETEIIDAVRAVVQAGKALNVSTPDLSRFVPMDIYEAAGRELDALKREKAENHKTFLLEKARQEGKITPAMMQWAKEFVNIAPESFEKWVKVAPDMRPDAKKTLASSMPPRWGSSTLTEEQKAICAAMGHDEANYQKHLNSQNAEQ